MDITRYLRNLQGEVDSAALYRAMSEHEPDRHLAEVYRRLASVEEGHAEFSKKKITAAGGIVSAMQPGWRTKILIWLAERFSAETVLPLAATLEKIDRGEYDEQPRTCDTQMPAQERSHARILSQLAQGDRATSWDGASYSRLEVRHGSGLRQALIGLAAAGVTFALGHLLGVAVSG